MEKNPIPQNSKDDRNNPIENPVRNVLLEESKKNEDCTGSKAENTKKNKHPKLKLWWKHNSIQAIMALATIGTLIAYIFVSIHQNNLTREALGRSDSANVLTKKSLDLTRKTDSIAEQALIHSIKADSENGVLARKDTLARFNNVKRELRAYLMVETILIDTVCNGDLYYKIILVNTGKTPAYQITGKSRIIANIQNIDKNEIEDFEKITGKNTTMSKGNGMKIIMNYNTKGTEFKTKLFDFIINQHKTFYILGKFSYCDVFGDYHNTWFCSKQWSNSLAVWDGEMCDCCNNAD